MRGDAGGRLRLSILDHTPVSSGSTLGDAFWHSTRLAELAEQIGYERYWVAQHHTMPWLASSSPAVLIAHVAARTTSLRVGRCDQRRVYCTTMQLLANTVISIGQDGIGPAARAKCSRGELTYLR